MKKNFFLTMISFTSLTTIICSCNSSETNNSSLGTKDTPVVEKKEVQASGWTTSSELILGFIQASLKIDGSSVNVDSGKITIRPKADFSAIEIFSSKGRLMLKPGWHGLGNYDRAFAEWDDLSERMATHYSSDYNAPGNMKVTEWADGKVTASFSVTVIENNSISTPQQKLLEGEFYYLKDR